MLAVAAARAKGLEIVAGSLGASNGHNAAALTVAEQYIHAFDKLAKTNNTVIIPKNVGDISSFVAQVKHVTLELKQFPRINLTFAFSVFFLRHSPFINMFYRRMGHPNKHEHNRFPVKEITIQ